MGDPGSNLPLLFVSAAQVNVQIPWLTVAGTCPNWPTVTVGCDITWLTATVNGQVGPSSQAFPLAPFAPGLFSMNGQGSGQGAILNSRYQLVDLSSPAQVGDVVQIYCTGLGAVTNQPATGSPALGSPLSYTTTTPTVTISSIPAKMLFSGLAPGNVGLYQVNVQVPSGLSLGLAVPVSLSIGGTTSNTVTMAVGPLPHYVISTVAGGSGGYGGDGGPAADALLNGPTGVAVDGSGNLYIADTGNQRIREVSLDGNINTIAGNGSGGYSGESGAALGDGGPAIQATLTWPQGMAPDAVGNLLVVDTYDHRIRKITPAGVITTVVGDGFNYSSCGAGIGTIIGLDAPSGIAVDNSGNVYFGESVEAAEFGSNCLGELSPGGEVVTAAGGGWVQGYPSSLGDGGPAVSAALGTVNGVAVDNGGNIYIADTSDRRIRKVSASTGIITTVAGNGLQNCGNIPCAPCGNGGPAVDTELLSPYGVAVDDGGNVYISDSAGACVGVILPNGNLIRIAGTGTYGYSGDGGPALNAQLANGVSGIAVDSSGNIYISDKYNDAVRVLRPAVP
jgi:uncharacterized protein (TIGR03437 family)